MKRRQLYLSTLACCLLLSLSGCNDDVRAAINPNKAAVQGIWQRSGDYVGHSGLFVGASSMMYYNKATETGFVMLLNGDGQHWLAPDESKSPAWQQAMLQVAARLYRHGVQLDLPAVLARKRP